MAVVFFPHHPMSKMDFSDTVKFGNMVQVFPQNLQAWGPKSSTDPLVDRAFEVMENSTPEDHVLQIGDPMLSAILVGVMLSLHGSVRLLKWDRIMNAGTGGYKSVELDFIRYIGVME